METIYDDKDLKIFNTFINSQGFCFSNRINHYRKNVTSEFLKKSLYDSYVK